MAAFHGVSVCITTDGREPRKTEIELLSIKKTFAATSIPYEIILGGHVSNLHVDTSFPVDLRTIDRRIAAQCGRLSEIRNSAASQARYDVIVFVDDDILFPQMWAQRFLQYCVEEDWTVLSNRILSPNGGRFWDRATISPHQLTDYDHPDDDSNLYQSGGFMIVRASVFREHQWDESIDAYAERHGGTNEDVEYSVRLVRAGHRMSFDASNTVWHWDYAYRQNGNLIMRCEATAYRECREFRSLLAELGALHHRPIELMQ